MSIIPFPSPGMDFGGLPDVSIAENEDLRLDIQKNVHRWRKPSYWYKTTPLRRTRRLNENNRLCQSELHLANFDDPESFWVEVLKIAPPKKWTDKVKVLALLARSKPMDDPWNNKILLGVMNWLDQAIQQGSRHNWNDNIFINVPAMIAEEWEAIRIIGDIHEGFGTYPKIVTEKMAAAGVGWIAVNPRKRVIPKCWIPWARMHNVTYKTAIATVAEDPVATIESTSQQAVHGTVMHRDITTQNSQQNRPLEIQRDKDTHNGHQYKSRSRAFNVLQPQEEVRMTDTWQAVDLNFTEMSKFFMDMHGCMMEDVRDLVKRTMRDIVIRGSVEENIQNELDDKTRKLHNAISQTVEQQEKIRELENEITRLKSQVEPAKRISGNTEAATWDTVGTTGIRNGDETNEPTLKRIRRGSNSSKARGETFPPSIW
ncbi:hypothetical protein GGR50DRAFT_696882 [Xylaria sp. CBS 124048]|nr:hypothetical protein GGR50DRAFT_696882 [Xylaria sp. CBS 124048]